MRAVELIATVKGRLRSIRRINLALTLLAPILLFTVSLFVVRSVTLPPLAAPVILALAGLGSLFFLERALSLLRMPSASEAAQLLDRSTDGKERFITLSALTEGDEGNSAPAHVAIIAAQAERLVLRFSPDEQLRFRLEPAARSSLLTSAPLAVILLALVTPQAAPLRTAARSF